MGTSKRHKDIEKERDKLFYEVTNRRKIPNTIWRKLLYSIQDLFKWCFYFPCPPCPCSIFRKVAFELTIPTYTLVATNSFTNKVPVYKFQMKPRYKLLSNFFKSEHVSRKQRKNVKAYFIRPSHTKQLACYYMKCCTDEASFVVLRCHANDTDIGLDLSLNAYLAWRISCDVFEFDYCGFGSSSGKPKESNVYKDVMAAYNFLTTDLNVDPSRIVVFGESIGTIPAVHLASSGVTIKGLVLEGVFMSACRIVCPTSKQNFICDQFQIIDKIPLITCPTLIVHSGMDRVTDFEHAKRFYDLCQTLVPPLIIPYAGHCHLLFYRAYWNRLEIFFFYELGGSKVMPYYRHCAIGCSEIHGIRHEEQEECHHGLSYPFKLHKDGSSCLKCDLGKCSEEPGFEFCLIDDNSIVTE